MPTVVIDGVEYVPRAEVPEITDQRLQGALESLTEILYFRECSHKHAAWARDALEALAPELAGLASDDPGAAYHRVRGPDWE
jgi:hypothetical protein